MFAEVAAVADAPTTTDHSLRPSDGDADTDADEGTEDTATVVDPVRMTIANDAPKQRRTISQTTIPGHLTDNMTAFTKGAALRIAAAVVTVSFPGQRIAVLVHTVTLI